MGNFSILLLLLFIVDFSANLSQRQGPVEQGDDIPDKLLRTFDADTGGVDFGLYTDEAEWYNVLIDLLAC